LYNLILLGKTGSILEVHLTRLPVMCRLLHICSLPSEQSTGVSPPGRK
jgi:hypothetical protein